MDDGLEKKLHRGDKIAFSVGIFCGFLSTLWALESAYDTDRLMMFFNVMAAAINYMNAMNAHGRLKRRHK